MKALTPSGRHTRPLPHPNDVPVMSRPARRAPLLGRVLVLAIAVLTLSGAVVAARLNFSGAAPAGATSQAGLTSATSPSQMNSRLQVLRRQITATRAALAQLPRLSTVLAQTGTKHTTTRSLEARLRAHLTELQAAERLLTTKLGPASVPPTPTGGQKVTTVIAYAKAQLGKPYQWGGTGPAGFDCSGLVQQAWKTAGVTLPRTSQDQAQAGVRTTRARLQPGDLIFTNGLGHVQLYIGSGQVIQARHTGTVVQITPWPDPQSVNAYVHIG